MLCRQCGTEIAEKALVCFRCGAATTEPAFKPPASGGRGSSTHLELALFGFVLLVLLVLFVVYEGPTQPELPPQAVQWAIIGGVVVIAVLRVLSRRRR